MDYLVSIILEAASQFEFVRGYGDGVYLITLSLVGGLLCFGGIWLFRSAFWAFGAVVGGSVGASFFAGGLGQMLSALFCAIAGAVLFRFLYALGAALLGGVIGLMLGSLTGNDVVIVIMTGLGAILAVKLTTVFVTTVTAVLGALALTFVAVTAPGYLESGVIAWEGGLSEYVRYLSHIVFTPAAEGSLGAVGTDLAVLLGLVVSGLTVQLIAVYRRNKKEHEPPEGVRQQKEPLKPLDWPNQGNIDVDRDD